MVDGAATLTPQETELASLCFLRMAQGQVGGQLLPFYTFVGSTGIRAAGRRAER